MAQHFQGPLRHLNAVVYERRCALYGAAAALIVDHEAPTHESAAALIAGLRRTLRAGLAFLDEPCVRELERLEALRAQLGAEGPLSTQLQVEVRDRVALLHLQLARLLQSSQGLADFTQIARLDPRLEQRLADESRAEQMSAQARAIEEECHALEAEARAQIASEEFTKASRALRRAIRLDPRRAVLHNDLGVVLSLIGKTEEAVAEYRAAIALNEQEPKRRTEEWTTSYYNLGVALRKLAQVSFRSGSVDEGRDHLDAAAESFAAFCELSQAESAVPNPPRLAEARAALSEIRRRLGAPLNECEPNPS